jgi:hypothetical protein
MFPRFTTVFASRWNAIWFAGMILLTAWCTVPAQQAESPAGDAAVAADSASRAIDDSRLSAEERKQARDALKAIEAMGKE